MSQYVLPHLLETEVRALRDEQQVVDALYRFAAGQDLRRPELFLSAFTADAQLDFTQPAQRLGANIPVMVGRAAIARILDTLAPLDTMHTVSNPRVELDGDQASLMALVEAQHVVRAVPYRYLLLKNVYEVLCVRNTGDWRIHSMVIRNIWYDGDPTVLFAGTVAP